MSEFTVVISVRQGFGNEPGYLNGIEANVPFVGATKTFPFQCPNVKTNEAAVLMFQSRDVDHSRNMLSINGRDIHGGIPVSPSSALCRTLHTAAPTVTPGSAAHRQQPLSGGPFLPCSFGDELSSIRFL